MNSIQIVQEQVQAWQQERNQAQTTINWRFTTTDARITLKRLYPSIQREQTTTSLPSLNRCMRTGHPQGMSLHVPQSNQA
jgi:hypothetical protein